MSDHCAKAKDSSLSLKKGSSREVEGKLRYCPGCPIGLISSCLPNITSPFYYPFFNDNELSYRVVNNLDPCVERLLMDGDRGKKVTHLYLGVRKSMVQYLVL